MKHRPLNIAVVLALSLSASTAIYADDAANSAPADNDAGKIYKKVGPNGDVIYSDQPSSGSEEMKVPSGSSYKPVEPSPSFTPYQPPPKAAAAPAIENTVTITSPKNDEAFWSGSGELVVTVALERALMPGQALEYQIDGNTLYTGSETSHSFSNIFRGTHVLTVQLKDEAGNTIASKPVTFHMQRPSIKK
ncbi:MAG: DUF4124 domain-containing protein [Gammaproteobacteria bacterium]|nr:DUF4124 domain-containing protein [Gammaproteobacteria bacterium]